MAQRLVILICLVSAWTVALAAPPALSGKIRGKVTDEATGEGLPWASVLIEGTTLGVATDADGRYELSLEPRTYRVVASYLGYVESARTVTVQDNATTELDFALTYGNDLAAVTISVQASGQIAAINEQLASNKIVNVVSAEKMEELPDANVAESIGRLPGISLQRSSGEANKIVVRGLSPKYNNVTIGGVKMASTNDFDRSADLSLITGEMLAGVEVSKSLRADMDADAIGGTIDLKIKAAQEGLHANGSAEGGYNQLGHSFRNHKLVGAVGNRFLDNRFGVRLQLSTERKQLPSHRFGGNYSSPIVFQELDDEGNLTGVKGYKLRTEGTVLTDQTTERIRDGGNLTLDYKSKWLDIKLFSLFNRKVDEGDSRVNTFRFTQPNEPFSKTASHFMTRTELWTHSLQNAFRLGRTTLNLTLAHSSADHRSSGQFFNFIELNTGADPINQEWLIFRQPAEVLALFGDTHVNDSYLQQMGFSESPLTDKNHDARLDWNIPFQLSQNLSCTFSVGGKYHRLERKSDNSQYFVDFQHGAGRARKEALIAMFPWINTNLSVQRGIAAPNFLDPGYDPGIFLDGRYQLGWGADIDLLTDIQRQYHPANVNFYQQSGYDNYHQDYNNREETFAGYAMAEINAGNKWMILPGLRYEQERTRYEGYHIEILGANANGVRGTPDSVAVRRKNAYFFPSLNLKYRMNPTVIFQGAVYRSATRPDFRRLSPTIVITEQPSSPFASGNPFLLPATAWNYDLGCLFHSNKLGLLTLNLFHKKVEGFIFTLNDYFPHRRDRIVSESAPAGLLDAFRPAISTPWTGWNRCTGRTSLSTISNRPPIRDSSCPGRPTSGTCPACGTAWCWTST